MRSNPHPTISKPTSLSTGLLALALLLAPATGWAAGVRPRLLELAPEAAVLTPTTAADCSDGLLYDDGSFEGPYTLAGETSADVLMRFDLPAVPAELDRLCVCWTRTGGNGAVDFDLLVYAADGPGSQPGTILTGLGGLRAESIPLFPQTAFYIVDLSSLGITLAAPRVYIGPSWNTAADESIFLCGDENGPQVRSTFYSTDQGGSWASYSALFPDLHALGVRAALSDGGEPFTCVPDDTTLCLGNGRFQVTVDWRTRNDRSGPGRVVPFGSDDSGLFYFFDEDNWEILVKTVDACGLSGHHWVFFAALTDVEFTLRVVDSATGRTKEYRNPLGHPADPVTDTAAFDTCP